MIFSAIYQVPLRELGLLRISGEQCVDFLQGQLSCDVKEVTATQSRLGVHCNAKGRVLATFRLFYIAPHYYLLLPQPMVYFLLKDLKKYAIFYKVALQDVTSSFQKTGFIHSNLLNGITLDMASFSAQVNAVYTDEKNTFLCVSGNKPRIILLGPIPETFANRAIQSKPFAYWENIDIQSGIASIMPETRSLFTPHSLNYHKKGGISFTKGCYTGQEVIARMHYLGKLKQRLYKFTLHSNACHVPGTDIVDQTGKAQGTLVTATLQSKEDDICTYQALAVIQDTAITDMLYLSDVACEQIASIAD